MYTKAGDTGRASTLTRQNIPKSSPIFELLGTLDELTSSLGIARAKAPQMADLVEQIQTDLLGISGELAGGKRFAAPDKVAQLERAIDSVCEGGDGFDGFVLPGKTEGELH